MANNTHFENYLQKFNRGHLHNNWIFLYVEVLYKNTKIILVSQLYLIKNNSINVCFGHV